MTFHTFECKYPLSGSKFATIHKELKVPILKVSLRWQIK